MSNLLETRRPSLRLHHDDGRGKKHSDRLEHRRWRNIRKEKLWAGRTRSLRHRRKDLLHPVTCNHVFSSNTHTLHAFFVHFRATGNTEVGCARGWGRTHFWCIPATRHVRVCTRAELFLHTTLFFIITGIHLFPPPPALHVQNLKNHLPCLSSFPFLPCFPFSFDFPPSLGDNSLVARRLGFDSTPFLLF